MTDFIKKRVTVEFIWLLAGLAAGFVIIAGVRLWNSFYMEGFAASAVGALALGRSRKPALILAGGLAAVSGWLSGLPVSIVLSERWGIGGGSWLLSTLFVFAIPTAAYLRRGKPIRALFIFSGGVGAGAATEIVQLLPSFVESLKFYDGLDLCILCASILVVPWVGFLSRRNNVRKKRLPSS